MKNYLFKIILVLTVLNFILLNCENREVTKSNNDHGGDITAVMTYENVFLEGVTLFASYVEARFDSSSESIEIDEAYFNDIFLLKYGQYYVLTNILQRVRFDFGEMDTWSNRCKLFTAHSVSRTFLISLTKTGSARSATAIIFLMSTASSASGKQASVTTDKPSTLIPA